MQTDLFGNNIKEKHVNNNKVDKGNRDGLVVFHDYIFWNNADIVSDYVYQFLRIKFPNDIITRETDKIDFAILCENLPVEIQSTRTTKYGPSHSGFEKEIEKQIKQNVSIYGKCWLFFDSEYLRYLQNDITLGSSINMDWFYTLIKEHKLKVFSVKYDGDIRELYDKDFDFLYKISNTDDNSRNLDTRILTENKLKIFYNILKGYRFTSDEIYNHYKKFYNAERQLLHDNKFRTWLTRKERTEREKLYGMLLFAMANLNDFNDILSCKCDKRRDIISDIKYDMRNIGLFQIRGIKNNSTTRFVDKFDVAKFFPGYDRNLKVWNHLRNQDINFDRFYAIVTGKVNIFWYEQNGQ